MLEESEEEELIVFNDRKLEDLRIMVGTIKDVASEIDSTIKEEDRLLKELDDELGRSRRLFEKVNRTITKIKRRTKPQSLYWLIVIVCLLLGFWYLLLPLPDQ